MKPCPDAPRWLPHKPSSPSSPCATMVGLKPPEVPPPAAVKFVSAGMAGCIADLCTFPLDTAKVRLQVRSQNPGQRERLAT